MPQAENETSGPCSRTTMSSSLAVLRRRAWAAALMPAASPPMTTSRSLVTRVRVSSPGPVRVPCAQLVHRPGGGGELGAGLADGPPAGGAVDGERGPLLAVLAGEVHQQRPVV